MPKVTILIPIYNVEKYVEQCVRSAMEQTLQEIEIICLNDGSTDGSTEILRKLAAEDERIRLVEKANTGYGHTMNMGLSTAKGKYVIFLESDDFILPNMCERMYAVCEAHELEVLKSDYYAFLMNEDKIYKRYRKVSRNNNYHMVFDADRQKEVFLSERYTWLCMYSRAYLEKYHIRHNETPGAAYQDNGFWFQTMMYGHRIYYLDEAFYMYRMDNPQASIHNKTNVKTVVKEYDFIRNLIREYSGEKKELYTIACTIDFKLNLWSSLRLNPACLQELSLLLQKEMQKCCSSDLFDFRMLSPYDAKQFLAALGNPESFCRYALADLEERKKKHQLLTQYDSVILYGAGAVANSVMWWIDELRVWDRDIYCAVSNPGENSLYFQGMEVRSLDEMYDYVDNAALIICTSRNSRYYEDMRDNAKKMNFKHVIDADDLLINHSWLSDFVIA